MHQCQWPPSVVLNSCTSTVQRVLTPPRKELTLLPAQNLMQYPLNFPVYGLGLLIAVLHGPSASTHSLLSYGSQDHNGLTTKDSISK